MKTLRTCLLAASVLLLPMAAHAQATVTCKDGAKSAGGRGACSSHGGVMTAATKAEMKADAKMAKAEKKADAKMARTETKADMKMDKMEKKADMKMAKDDDRDARGATAECKDHTYSHAASHQGACSRHGGVSRFLDGKK
jgi:hypothetical protein